jgi:hypothetical protein
MVTVGPGAGEVSGGRDSYGRLVAAEAGDMDEGVLGLRGDGRNGLI